MFEGGWTVQDEGELGKGESGMAQTEQWEGWLNGMHDLEEGFNMFMKGLDEFVDVLNEIEDMNGFLVGGGLVHGWEIVLGWRIGQAGVVVGAVI